MNNRQLRSWVFMLYPDNPAHEKAINYLDVLDNSLYIKHIAKYNDDGSVKNKEHYHCVLRYEKGYWLSKLLSDLDLPEEDDHLFHSYKDFKRGKRQKYKSLEEYVSYLDHQFEDDKPDKYTISDFHGGLKAWATSIFSSRELDKPSRLLEMCNFVREYNLNNFPDTRLWSFQDWYKLCCDNGYAADFYREWYKMRDVLAPYIYK